MGRVVESFDLMPELDRSIFKAYDVRGHYPDELNEDAAERIVFALTKKFRKGTIVLGRDGRLSSPSIYKAIEAVFLRAGFKVESLGVCTTPMFYFAAMNMKSAGVMVTASHTPKEFNGLKVVNDKGEVISGEQILKWISLEAAPAPTRSGGAMGRAVFNGVDHLKKYVHFLEESIKLTRPMSVVFDCSNGTTGKVLKELFSIKYPVFGIEYKLLNEKPDGNFPAHGPNPLAAGALGQLKRAVVKSRADFGAAFDADGDRAFFVDNRGREVSSDVVLGLLAQAFTGPIVIDSRVGYLGREIFKAISRKVIESRVGHFFMKKLMKEKKAGFGGELSGHYYFPVNGAYFDSGVLAAAYFANEVSGLKSLGGNLSEWIDSLPEYYCSGEVNFKVSEKQSAIALVEKRYSALAKKVSKKDGLKMEFADWWFVLRASNTENLLRLVVEAKSKKVLDKRLAELRRLI